MHSNESIGEIQYNQIMTHLSDLVKKLQLSGVLLVNSAGRIIAEQIARPDRFETSILATLASGSYAAAEEMSRQLGKNESIKMMLYECDKQNVFICSVTETYYLVIIFETSVALGMVRLLVKRALCQLVPILSQSSKNQFEELFDQRFSGLLNEKLNKSFLDE